MAASLGSLVVSLGLDAAEFVSGLTKAEYQSKKAMDNIGRSIDNGAKSLLALGVGVAFYSTQLINAASDLDDMAERTGASVEELSKLDQQARISGTSIEAVEGAIIKLTKGLNESDEGAVKTQRALAALGLSVEDLRKMDPAVAFKTVAKALDGFEDSGAKTALAMDAMGKSAAGVLPFMKDLANDAELSANVTKEQAAQAEELGKAWSRLQNDVRNVALAFALDLLPFAKDVIAALGNMGTSAGKVSTDFNPFKETLRTLAVLGLNVAYVFTTVAKDIAGIGAVLTLFAQGEFTAGRELGKALVEDAKLARAEFDKMEALLLNAGNAAPAAATGGATGGDKNEKTRRDLVYKDITAAKAASDARLKMSESAAKIELAALKDAGENRQALLDLQRQQNLVGDRDYYSQRLAIAKTTLDAELKVIDDRIKREQQAVRQTRAGSKDSIEAQTKLQETEAQRNKLISDFGQFSKVNYEQAKIAADSYRRSVEDINTRLLEMTGQTEAAARARADAQFEDISARATANGDSDTLAKVNRLKELTVAQAQFGAEQTKQGEIAARLAIEEERIQNAQRVGAIGEIEALARTGAARQKAVKDLELIVSKLEDVARASQNPALILQAEQARAALEKLRTETDLLGEKFDTIFKDAAASSFSEFIKGTKSAKEAFNDFATSVANAITDLAAQDLAKSIFGSSGGSGGGIGGIFAKIFGGGATSTAPAGASGGGIGGGGSGIMGWLASLLPSFDVGTPFVPQDMLALIHRGERIVPAAQNRMGGGGGTIVNMNVVARDAGSFRASRGQMAAQMASTLNAARRNM